VDVAMAGAGGSAARRGQLTLHALANLLLGASIGLLAYCAITNVLNSVDQSSLRTKLLPAAVRGLVASPSGLAVMDFSAWDTTDRLYWEGLTEGGVFARLVIPKMELDTVVVRGTAAGDLRKGPGWIEDTSLPGATGNVGISGHRTTYGAPFGRLGEVAPGDTIDLYSPYRRYRYEVVKSFVVTPDRVDVVAYTEEPMLTLTACHPPFSARQRLIVQARLVDVRLLEAGAPPSD
jgi:LPXTG-site transpeptidase (sortase) family protein